MALDDYVKKVKGTVLGWTLCHEELKLDGKLDLVSDDYKDS